MKSYLQDAIDNGSRYGICQQLMDDKVIQPIKYVAIKEFIKDQCIARGWYTGNETYPLMHPEATKHHQKRAYHGCANKFDKNTEYGQRRILIAELIIKEFYP